MGDEWHRQLPLVSNGPFVLTELDDDHMLMVANPYWTGRRGNLREIVVSFRVHGHKVRGLWERGDLDVLASPYAAEEDEGTDAEYAPGLGTTMLGFHAERTPFADIRLRRAVAGVLARVGDTFGPLGLVGRPARGGGLLPPAMPGHDHHVSMPVDLESARALLAEAGYPGGEGLPALAMVLARGLEPLQATIEARLGELGLGVRFTLSDRGARIAEGPGDMWMTTWLADYPDPDGFFRGLLSDPCDPIADERQTQQLVALMEEARTCQDQDDRLQRYQEIDRLLVAEWVDVVPIAYARTALLRRPWVHGLWANALTPLRLDGVVIERPAE
jgi:ABC-type transport system substrate-binding protein